MDDRATVPAARLDGPRLVRTWCAGRAFVGLIGGESHQASSCPGHRDADRAVLRGLLG